MAITASVVQKLRKMTNAGMMACKEALKESDGDLDAAAKILREKGMTKAVKRAGRETSEGLVAAQVNGGTEGVIVEVNCETDFVAKNDNFQAFVADITNTIANSDVTDAEAAAAVAHGDGTVQDAMGAKFAELGEVIKIKRLNRYSLAANGTIASYIHMGGKVGVILELTCGKAETAATETFQELARDLCLHTAASNPAGLNRDDIDASTIEEEKEISRKQLLDEGKPEQIIEKILVGKINKFYSEVCLVDQAFVKDDKVSITELLTAKGKELDDSLSIARYERYTIGA
ncbi:elongation factor Ts [Verrucomicrobiaceae bacterium N1E253]|uniref:Elongation factor Ts n=1 Tax=Oceaniferula marina TaxID=2748318 RepID=A0A851GDW7_9BACT|nr:translation elongation factor Ts [Oceaniferula marina]NWK55122.1 elongation factor Ts [Oceaniferula marina]